MISNSIKTGALVPQPTSAIKRSISSVSVADEPVSAFVDGYFHDAWKHVTTTYWLKH